MLFTYHCNPQTPVTSLWSSWKCFHSDRLLVSLSESLLHLLLFIGPISVTFCKFWVFFFYRALCDLVSVKGAVQTHFACLLISAIRNTLSGTLVSVEVVVESGLTISHIVKPAANEKQVSGYALILDCDRQTKTNSAVFVSTTGRYFLLLLILFIYLFIFSGWNMRERQSAPVFVTYHLQAKILLNSMCGNLFPQAALCFGCFFRRLPFWVRCIKCISRHTFMFFFFFPCVWNKSVHVEGLWLFIVQAGYM